MVRDARDVCGSRVRRAGREEQRGDEPQRGWRTLGARTDITRVFTPSFFDCATSKAEAVEASVSPASTRQPASRRLLL